MPPDIHEMAPGRVLVSYGPLHMSVLAHDDQGPNTRAAWDGAEYAAAVLEQIVPWRLQFRAWPPNRHDAPDVPAVVRLMAQAAEQTGDPDLTPMAAVAGSTSELVADYLAERGMTKVVVNNGGDLAIRLAGDNLVRIGIVSDLNTRQIGGRFELDARQPKWGVATSGLGGRSFSRGIASAVTVLAGSASVADACATAVANRVFTDHPGIRQERAETIDPDTDIRGRLVTVEVTGLDEAAINDALAAGAAAAQDLIGRGVLQRAWLYLGEMSVTV